MTDEDNVFAPRTIIKATDYIFAKFQETNSFWMIPMTDRDTALEQAIEKTVKGSRKECVDEKCQMSMVSQLQANFLINTKIKKLYEGTCNITISKFDVEKRAGVQSWVEKFNCTEKGLYETIDSFNFGGKKKGSFQEGRIGETVENWEVGDGEEIIVKFESDPSDAVVLVDGRIVCQKTPCSRAVKKGKHIVVIQKEDYLPKEETLDIKEDFVLKMSLNPDFGWLTVYSSYEIDVVHNGHIIGKTPIIKYVASPGSHQIETENQCYYKTGEKIYLKRGEEKIINFELKPKESGIKVIARDKKGNDIKADVFVDGKKVGVAPGTFKVPLCSKKLVVKRNKGIFKQDIVLQEKKISYIDAVLMLAKDAKSDENIKIVQKVFSNKSSKNMTWYAAKNYCANLEDAGYYDWRLPSISELRTLIGYCLGTKTNGECGISDDCLLYNCRSDVCDGCMYDGSGKYSKFGDTDILWSSSIQNNFSDNAWVINFAYASFPEYSNVENSYYVRCVRP
ncbi:MAG TPA: PEGA domain-containing protein [bacterium]|nr:PEGA domain-containing protein [bacterium]